MIEIAAYYYDGTSARRYAVMLALLGDSLCIRSSTQDEFAAPLSFPFNEVSVSDRLGNTPRSISLPGGARCETRDNDAVDQWLKARGKQGQYRLLHKLESRFGYAVIALAITISCLWAAITVGAPTLSKFAAERLPPQTEEMLGGQVLATLDKAIFSPSKLSPEKQKQVSATFNRINQTLQRKKPLQLVFRKGDSIGANALALPSGTIVITDELVKLAENQDELFAVLAHEAGHVMHHHSLRGWLQDSIVVLIITGLTSDASSIGMLAAGLPTALVEAKYSREFENEADDYAYQKMVEQKVPLKNFAAILSRLEKSAHAKPAEKNAKQDAGKSSAKTEKTDNNQEDSDVMEFMASHPATAERIKRFQVE